MKSSLSRRIAPAVLAFGAVGGIVGATAGSAFAATKPMAATKSGVVSSVDAKTHEITVKVGKVEDHFKITDKSKVTMAGKKSAVSALKAGEHVRVTYSVSGKAWIVTAISVAKG